MGGKSTHWRQTCCRRLILYRPYSVELPQMIKWRQCSMPLAEAPSRLLIPLNKLRMFSYFL